ncbi:MAG: hypothetical protein QW481_05000 [Candidatus Methanomethylicia archaeon]
MEIIYLGFLASLLAGLATGIGAIPIFLKESFSDDTLDVLLGFAAGVMSAATAFSLLVPAIDLSGPWIAMGGLIIGAFLLHLLIVLLHIFTPLQDLKVHIQNSQKFGFSLLL